jgi:sulfate transport system substrate-binding protein
MISMSKSYQLIGLLLLAALISSGCDSAQGKGSAGSSSAAAGGQPVELLNVSYDATRELWKELNLAFQEEYRKAKGIDVSIQQSHGGSSTQARNVIEGQEADVVTLAMPTDTEAIEHKGLIKEGWQDEFPNGSLPFSSTIVFVVRKGNPKQIKDWPDLIREGVEIITPHPKTSGNGKLSFLAAWGSVVRQGGSEAEAKEFVTKLYQHAPVLPSGGRAATTTFAQQGLGDVHLAWESEAYFEIAETGGELEIVVPSISIRAEPRVAIVDANVDRKGTRSVAQDYLNFLYTDVAQEIIAKHHYRPSTAEILSKHSDEFAKVKLFPVQGIAKNWDDASRVFFADGAIFDSIYKN